MSEAEALDVFARTHFLCHSLLNIHFNKYPISQPHTYCLYTPFKNADILGKIRDDFLCLGKIASYFDFESQVAPRWSIWVHSLTKTRELCPDEPDIHLHKEGGFLFSHSYEHNNDDNGVTYFFGANRIDDVPMPWKRQMISHLESVTNLFYYEIVFNFSFLRFAALFVDEEDGPFLHQLLHQLTESENCFHAWEKQASDFKLTHKDTILEKLPLDLLARCIDEGAWVAINQSNDIEKRINDLIGLESP